MVPLWTAQLLSGVKSFERNPVIGSRRLNEKGLHVARVSLAHRLAAARRRRLTGLAPAADREDFARDGFVIREDFMPPADFAALLDQLHAYRGMLREITEGDTVMRKIALEPAALAALPALQALLHSAEWRGLIRYVGSRDAEPVVWIQSILRHAADGPPDPQTALHADTFHPTVKAWLFLTDVAADIEHLQKVGLTVGEPCWFAGLVDKSDFLERCLVLLEHHLGHQRRAGHRPDRHFTKPSSRFCIRRAGAR
jgi:hypothetical protein